MVRAFITCNFRIYRSCSKNNWVLAWSSRVIHDYVNTWMAVSCAAYPTIVFGPPKAGGDPIKSHNVPSWIARTVENIKCGWNTLDPFLSIHVLGGYLRQ